MLTEWALKFKGLKKRLAWLLYQKRDLRSVWKDVLPSCRDPVTILP